MTTTPHVTSVDVPDPEIGEMISHGAADRGVSVEAYVAEAVREAYKRQRTEEIRSAMRGMDGSVASSVSRLTGLSRRRLEELGGVGE